MALSSLSPLQLTVERRRYVSEIPTGPVVQENEGRATPAPTFEDMLKNPTDELLFEYHATSQIVVVKLAGGAIKPLGKPGLFSEVEASPDGRYIFAKELHHPFPIISRTTGSPSAAKSTRSPPER